MTSIDTTIKGVMNSVTYTDVTKKEEGVFSKLFKWWV